MTTRRRASDAAGRLGPLAFALVLAWNTYASLVRGEPGTAILSGVMSGLFLSLWWRVR